VAIEPNDPRLFASMNWIFRHQRQPCEMKIRFEYTISLPVSLRTAKLNRLLARTALKATPHVFVFDKDRKLR